MMNEDSKSTTSASAPPAGSIQPVEPCTLALQSFPVLDVQACCPIYADIIQASVNNTSSDAAGASSLAAIPMPSTEDFHSLQRELELLVQSTTYRIKRLTEEYQKSDTFVKHHRDSSSIASTLPNSHQGIQPTIKLDLKKLKGDVAGGDIPAVKAKRKKKDGSPAKRKRAVGEQSDTDNQNRDDISSVTGNGSVATGSNNLKKKQRKDDDDRASVVASEGAGADAEAKVKPSQQITSTTFWNYIDAFFKNITEDDLQVLEEGMDDDPEPYLMPPLGRPYQRVWAEEDKAVTAKSRKVKNQRQDDSGISPDLYCGPLTERLLSALIEEDIIFDSSSQYRSDYAMLEPVSPSGVPATSNIREPSKEEMYSIEQRLKRELRILGLLEDEMDVDEDDDEVSRELRRLQDELRRVTVVNRSRKQIVRERAIDQMALCEYRLVLDELDKQVEQAFLKRQRIIQKRKKKTSGSLPAPEGVHPLLERRRKLIEEFAPVLPPDLVSIPVESIFEDDGGEWLSTVSLIPPPPPAVMRSATHSVAASPTPGSSVLPAQQIDMAIDLPEGTTAVDPSATNASGDQSSTAPTAAKPRKKYTKKKKADVTGETDQTGSVVSSSSTQQPKKARAPKKERKRKVLKGEEDITASADGGVSAADGTPSLDNGNLLPDWMYSGDLGPV
eukprot:Partr_v1_DN27675_c1_g1_i1_m65189 putative transcriptional adaptor 3